jgi:hypothetical protein
MIAPGRDESGRIQNEIRHVLLNVWDPIGIRDEPNAQDEYDSYIGKLYELLMADAPETEFVSYLHYVAHDLMGFDAAQMKHMIDTATALKMIAH